MTRRLASGALALLILAMIGAPFLAPHDPGERFPDHSDAPPTPLRIRDATGAWRLPFFYALRIESRLERRFEEDRTSPVSLAWLTGGRLVREAGGQRPFLLLGADVSGRDVFARLIYGARISLGIAIVAIVGAVSLGLLVGGLAGARGGPIESALMRLMDVLAVLPALYVVVVLRAALPLVLEASAVAALIAAILAAIGAPWIARGVRAIVSAERATDYAEAARALGASPLRILLVHLLPATRGFILRQATLLLPVFVLAEATLSFVGLGLPDTVPSWGTSLREAADVTAIAAFPWILSPAAALFLVTLLVNLALGDEAGDPSIGAGVGARSRS
jgi:peptide/nickel transport system permease protein